MRKSANQGSGNEEITPGNAGTLFIKTKSGEEYVLFKVPEYTTGDKKEKRFQKNSLLRKNVF